MNKNNVNTIKKVSAVMAILLTFAALGGITASADEYVPEQAEETAIVTTIDDTPTTEAPTDEAAAESEPEQEAEPTTETKEENPFAFMLPFNPFEEAPTDGTTAEPENTATTEAPTEEVHIPSFPYMISADPFKNAVVEAPTDEAAAESESTTATEENKNEDNPDELREEDKSERTKTLETVSKALNPVKEKTGIDDKIVDKVVDKLNDKFVEDTGHELPKEEKIYFTESGKILYNTVEGTFMAEIVPGIGGYRAMVKFNELMSKAQDAKTPELREKYLKEAQLCCREGIVKCIPGGSIVLSGTELVLSTTKYAINKTFGTDFDFDVNPLHWELPESKQNINDILECGKIKDVPQNQDVANLKEYIKNMRSGF